MKILATLLAGPALVVAGSASAQTPPDQADNAEAYEAPQSSAASDEQVNSAQSADASFTDAEIEKFAAAALKIEKLDGDPATQKEQVAAIVAESGLTSETFNAISQAMRTDTEVAERVQIAARDMQGSAG